MCIRRGISPEAFAELCRISAQKFYETSDSLRRWHGYPVMAIDGTLLQLPQTERNMDVFGRAKNQSGTPRAEASASALFDVLNDLIADPWIGALNYGERKRALRHMDALACMRPDNGDVLLDIDRGYPSYEIFQEIINRGMSFVIRLGSSFSASIIKHPGLDFFVDYMPKRHKEPVRLRIVRVVLDDGTVETLATNLYSPAFTAELLEALTDTADLDAEQERLQNEGEVVMGLIRKVISDNAQKAMDQAEYGRKYNGYCERYEAARLRLAEIGELRLGRIAKRTKISLFLKELASREGLVEEFDEELWYATVDHVAVYEDMRMVFTFRDHTQVEVPADRWKAA